MTAVLYLLVITLSIVMFFLSYMAIDQAITLMLGSSHESLNQLHNIIQFSNTHREAKAYIFGVVVTLMLAIQLTLVRSGEMKRFSIKKLFILAGIIAVISTLSYPFLSYDIFSYLFFTKVAWVYHLNPFTINPRSFMETDIWVGFLRNIDDPYMYGPAYLGYTLVPMMILSGSRFLLNFFAVKLMNVLLFGLGGWLLYKILKKDTIVFSLWFFNPFLIIEFLINAHNDLFMVVLYYVALFFMTKRKYIPAWLAFITSVSAKYASIIGAPALLLNDRWREVFFKLATVGLFIFLQTTKHTVQPWYFTWFYLFIPFIHLKKSSWVMAFLVGYLTLMHYYSFILYDFYDRADLIPFSQIWIYILVVGMIANEMNLWSRVKKSKIYKKYVS